MQESRTEKIEKKSINQIATKTIMFPSMISPIAGRDAAAFRHG